MTKMLVLGLFAATLYPFHCGGEEPQCSRYHYVDQILAKVVRLEHRLEQFESQNKPGGSTTATLRCPDTWIRFQDSCYLFPQGDVNFSMAEFVCVQRGSHIVHIETELENNFLKNHMMDLKDSSYWIGLTDRDSDGSWRWHGTGTNALFTDWSSHSPNNYGGNQHCTFMEFGQAFKWNDMPCDNKYRVVCEINNA